MNDPWMIDPRFSGHRRGEETSQGFLSAPKKR
jgi:hypothetical protein